ncbi:ArnT family glycosyltransferase [Vreelandella sulfidaeris]|uniref:ArnT family glycosyltransferase n=1 Tax=Vreelandella sulfidaeris TaxID=115553 RepID=UPI0035E7EC14
MFEISFVLILFVLSAVYCLWMGYRHRWLIWPLVFAYLFRVFLFVLDYTRVFRPPGATADSSRFISHAQHYANMEWHEIFNSIPLFSSSYYAWLGGLFQKVVGESSLFLIATSFFFGHVVVVITAIICYQLWGKRTAIWAAMIMALYPFGAFNSILAMREEIAIMFFLMGLYFYIHWVAGKSPLGLVWGGLLFGVSVLFHPGWVAAFFGVAAYLAYFLYRSLVRDRQRFVTKLHASKVLLAVGMLFFSVGIIAFSGGISLGKGVELGGESDEGITDTIEERFAGEATGGSAYPSFVAQGNPFTQPWLIPARIIYFHFSPFPWDIRSPLQVTGLISSVLYWFLAWRVYRGWNELKQREECLAMLFIFGAITFVFALGVNNIGTAIRHKTKLLGLFVILAASSFKSLRIRLTRK